MAWKAQKPTIIVLSVLMALAPLTASAGTDGDENATVSNPDTSNTSRDLSEAVATTSASWDFEEPGCLNEGVPVTPLDTDGDGTPDAQDEDDDCDGFSDALETDSTGTNPQSGDTDADGLPDYRDLNAQSTEVDLTIVLKYFENLADMDFGSPGDPYLEFGYVGMDSTYQESYFATDIYDFSKDNHRHDKVKYDYTDTFNLSRTSATLSDDLGEWELASSGDKLDFYITWVVNDHDEPYSSDDAYGWETAADSYGTYPATLFFATGDGGEYIFAGTEPAITVVLAAEADPCLIMATVELATTDWSSDTPEPDRYITKNDVGPCKDPDSSDSPNPDDDDPHFNDDCIEHCSIEG